MPKKNAVTNTTVEARRDPLLSFAKVLLTGGSSGIETMEKRGQEEFLESDILPTNIHDLYEHGKETERGSGRKLLETWGFKFGKVVGGDTLFTQAKLPPGWKKSGSEHDMWSYILDAQGRARCSVFYKAAFYDRSTHLGICPRYRAETEYEDNELRHDGRSRGVVKEVHGGNLLFAGKWHGNPTEGSNYERKYGAYDASQKDAGEWYKAHLPQSLLEQWRE